MSKRSTHNNSSGGSDLSREENSVLRRIYTSHYNRLLQYGCSIENDRDLVHNVIQDLFIWLILHPDHLDKIKTLDAYLYKSVRRNVRAAASKSRKRKIKDAIYLSAKKLSITSKESQIITEETQNHQNEWLTARLDQLSSHQKEVIFLRFFEKRDYAEIAAIQGVSQQVVRNSVFRAIKKLRKNKSSSEFWFLVTLAF